MAVHYLCFLPHMFPLVNGNLDTVELDSLLMSFSNPHLGDVLVGDICVYVG